MRKNPRGKIDSLRTGKSMTSAEGPVSVATGADVSKSADPSATANPGEKESGLQSLGESSLRNIPSALISLIFHLLLILIIAFVNIPSSGEGRFSFFLENSDSLDDDFDQLLVVNDAEEFVPEVSVAQMELSESQNNLEFQPELMPVEATLPTPVNPSNDPKFALSGRGEKSREGMLLRYGGTPQTEDAVELGLKWLAKNQQRDGTWSLKGPYRSNVPEENMMAATGLALLAFLGHGETHRAGPYQKVVERGIKSLIENQAGNGHFVERRASLTHSLYSHAICSIAICELLALTQDETLLGPARDAVSFAVKAQGLQGGWKYEVGDPRSDLSVTGWFVMLFQSAKYAGIEFDISILERTGGFLDTVMLPDGSRFRYEPDHEPSLAMTAEGLLCRQYLGWKKNDARLMTGSEYLLKNPIRWSQKNVYYWYYGTQVMRHLDDESWKKWNDVLKDVIPKNQVKNGVDRGSWDPTGDPYGGTGGRLYVTCLCLFSLEVYYRHLPIYQNP